MKYRNKLKNLALILTAAGSLSAVSVSVEAATSIATKMKEFTPENATQTLSVRPKSWYDPTMGFTGWTHTSNWGYMKLKKGKPVTIIAETDVAGFHPGLTLWYRPQKKGLAPVDQMNAHSYNQFSNIYEVNALNTDDQANPVKIGTIRMEYIANAFDRDSWSGTLAPLSAEFDQSGLNRVLDGVPGKVSLTFTPQFNGVYQFVVGGINPDADKNLGNSLYSVEVTVGFPE
jgi:hypothetical protein